MSETMTDPEAQIQADVRRAESQLAADDPFWPAQIAILTPRPQMVASSASATR